MNRPTQSDAGTDYSNHREELNNVVVGLMFPFELHSNVGNETVRPMTFR